MPDFRLVAGPCPRRHTLGEWPFLTADLPTSAIVASLRCDFGVATLVAALMQKLAIVGDAVGRSRVTAEGSALTRV